MTPSTAPSTRPDPTPTRPRRRRARRLALAASAAGLGAAGFVAVAPDASADDFTTPFHASVGRDVTGYPADARFATDLIVPTATCSAGDAALPVIVSLDGSRGDSSAGAGGQLTIGCSGASATYSVDTWATDAASDQPALGVRPGDRVRIEASQVAGARVQATATVERTGQSTTAVRNDWVYVAGASLSTRLSREADSAAFTPITFTNTTIDGRPLGTEGVDRWAQVDASGAVIAEPSLFSDSGRTVSLIDRR